MKNEKYISINKIAELKELNSNHSLRLAIQKSKYAARVVKVFGGKSYEILMNINKDDKNCKAEFLPSIADMISYTQENRNKIEQTTFSRTYFPLIVTLIIRIIIYLAQIYYCISSKEPEAILIFDKAEKYYSKIIN